MPSVPRILPSAEKAQGMEHSGDGAHGMEEKKADTRQQSELCQADQKKRKGDKEGQAAARLKR